MLKKGSKLDALLREVNQHRVIDESGKVSYRGFGVHQISIALRTYIEDKFSLPQVVLNGILINALSDREVGPTLDHNSLKAALYRASNRYRSLPLQKYYMLTSWSADLFGIVPRTINMDETHLRMGNVPKKFQQNDAKKGSRKITQYENS